MYMYSNTIVSYIFFRNPIFLTMDPEEVIFILMDKSLVFFILTIHFMGRSNLWNHDNIREEENDRGLLGSLRNLLVPRLPDILVRYHATIKT